MMRSTGVVLMWFATLGCYGGTDSSPVTMGGPAGGAPEAESAGTSSGDSTSDDAVTGATNWADGSSTDAAGTSAASSDDTSGAAPGGSSSSGEPDEPPDGVLLWLLDAESGDVQPPAQAHDGAELTFPNGCGGGEGAFVVSDDQPVHGGARSLAVRFDRAWYEDNPGCNTVKSAFVQGDAAPLQADTEYWHGFAVYVTADAGGSGTVLRWATAGQTNKTLRLNLTSDLSWRFSSSPIGSDHDLTLTPETIRFGDGRSEVWHEFVASFVLSTDEDAGYVKLWHRVQGEDWEQVVDATGRTANFDAPFPFEARMGMHSGHSYSGSADAHVLYFDEIRLGDASSGFDAVAPGANTTVAESP